MPLTIETKFAPNEFAYFMQGTLCSCVITHVLIEVSQVGTKISYTVQYHDHKGQPMNTVFHQSELWRSKQELLDHLKETL